MGWGIGLGEGRGLVGGEGSCGWELSRSRRRLALFEEQAAKTTESRSWRAQRHRAYSGAEAGQPEQRARPSLPPTVARALTGRPSHLGVRSLSSALHLPAEARARGARGTCTGWYCSFSPRSAAGPIGSPAAARSRPAAADARPATLRTRDACDRPARPPPFARLAVLLTPLRRPTTTLPLSSPLRAYACPAEPLPHARMPS